MRDKPLFEGGFVEIFIQFYRDDPLVSQMARDGMARKIQELKEQYPDSDSRIVASMRNIWRGYDAGGHSHGRSLRAGILEKAQEFFNKGNVKKSSFLVSLLVAMYHDTEYLKRSWHADDKFFAHWTDSLFSDRVYLMTLADAMGISEIPSLEEWNREKIIKFLRTD